MTERQLKAFTEVLNEFCKEHEPCFTRIGLFDAWTFCGHEGCMSCCARDLCDQFYGSDSASITASEDEIKIAFPEYFV